MPAAKLDLKSSLSKSLNFSGGLFAIGLWSENLLAYPHALIISVFVAVQVREVQRQLSQTFGSGEVPLEIYPWNGLVGIVPTSIEVLAESRQIPKRLAASLLRDVEKYLSSHAFRNGRAAHG